MVAKRKVLTAAYVERVRAPKEGQDDHFDAALPGFALRVSYKGARSWVVMYRSPVERDKRGNRKQCRMTIGRFPGLDLVDAREKAREYFDMVERGIDPARERERPKAVIEGAPETFGALADLFIERYAKRQTKGWKETERIFEVYLKPHWSHLPITEIRKPDVAALLDFVEDNHGRTMANRTLAAVRKCFNWAIDERGLLEFSPVGRNMARGKEVKRERVLTDDEIKAAWLVGDGKGYPFGPFLKLLFMTAQRRSEVSGMCWSELSDDLTIWTIPAERAKNKRRHEVPLPEQATELLSAMPRVKGVDYVFSTGRSVKGDRPISGFSKFKRKLGKDMVPILAEILDVKPDKVKIPEWWLHDIRRTASTVMGRCGIPRDIRDRVLNHTDRTVGAVYDRHEYRDEKRHALEALGQYLDGVIDPDKTDKVIPIKGQGGNG